MVGLSILLEAQKNRKGPLIISKATMLKSSSPPSSPCTPSLPAITFLDACFLCKKRLSPGKDIYMYRGDRAFCSLECRCRQIFMDEESSYGEKNCSLAASSSASSSHPHRKGNKKRAGGLFAY